MADVLSTKSRLIRDGRIGLEWLKRATEFVLDALERRWVVGLEADHDHGRRIRSPGEAEAVGIFGSHAVNRKHAQRPWEGLRGLQLRHQRMRLALRQRPVEFRRRRRIR